MSSVGVRGKENRRQEEEDTQTRPGIRARKGERQGTPAERQ